MFYFDLKYVATLALKGLKVEQVNIISTPNAHTYLSRKS
jgi:hypothetical protein